MLVGLRGTERGDFILYHHDYEVKARLKYPYMQSVFGVEVELAGAWRGAGSAWPMSTGLGRGHGQTATHSLT